MLPRTLKVLFAITFVVNATGLNCKKLVRGKAITVNLRRENIISFPTTGVLAVIKPGETDSTKVEFDAIQLYSRKDHIISLYLTVNFAPRVGAEGSLEVTIEHIWCGDVISEDDCSEGIPDDTYPVLRMCELTPFTATDQPIGLQLKTQEKFLVVTHLGKFVGKAAIPSKDCDLQKRRQKINKVGISEDSFTDLQPQFCQ